MSIDRDFERNVFVIHCDTPMCEKFEEFDTDGDWWTMIEQAKDVGWVIRKENGVWFHYHNLRCANSL